ncbi:bifunctional 4-hydroxy-2-oxoglutarate aldolase/2-dehydro-3-deoxy-phosphogluconate aldolase [Actinocatenispora rupis]|uniref:2-keto-3-deoxy-phosphogluconate aldolase n=1 Tax=Actinocatenispora rupis TaxID=519421 RepID=A0A8J3NCR0_9ACTN|nr:bifunctional 4-hydroxy-2-oxoglutarate aldolase/2-dehydro-3-deoxy-phosphogluconate aldolase [Actinocatenispora rupis]GID14271.1 2-keto-3-deoxy-phosphogluconate aldolase [Actinocatenispora rupis]
MTVPSRQTPSRALTETGVVPILRGKKTGEHLPAVLDTLVDNGIRCLEITTNTPGAFAAVTAAHERYGADVELGIGTVLTVDDVRAAEQAGAAFIVCPHTDPELADAALARGLGYYPGAFTATEVLTAWKLGATAVKIFPASVAGPKYLRELGGPIDGVPLLPTGGVTVELVPEYLAAGAIAVGMGGPLVGDALDGGDLGALATRTRRVLDAVAGTQV